MVVEFDLLGLFEFDKFPFGIEVAVIVGAGKDSNIVGDSVVANTDHGLITLWAGESLVVKRTWFFGDDRINIFGGVVRNEIDKSVG